MAKKTKDPLNDQVYDLIGRGKVRAARHLVKDALASAEGSKRETLLLELLINVELSDGQIAKALRALDTRRSLGFRSAFESFDAGLLRASLLIKSERFLAARSELTELVINPKSINWPSLLDALDEFVRADEQCRRIMGDYLVRGYEASTSRFGIPATPEVTARGVGPAIKKARELFRQASRAHQRLTIKALTAPCQQARDAIAEEVTESVALESVAYFRELGLELVRQLAPHK